MSEDEGKEARAVRRMLAPLTTRPPVLAPERQAVVWQQIQARRHAPRRVGWGWPALGAAATAAAALALWAQRSEPLNPAALPAPEVAVAAGTGLVDQARPLPSGARVDVAGQLTVLEPGPEVVRLRLEAGQVTSHVPHLAAGQRYRVETPAAAVEVRGTVFTVHRLPGDATEVSVAEGRVEVQPVGALRPVHFVSAGERWTAWPANPAGQSAAQAAGDADQALDIQVALAWDAPAGLARQNRLVALGHTLDAQADAERSAHFWAALGPQAGPHAEEAAFREAAALLRAGHRAEAQAAGAGFRARYPSSAFVAETLAW